MLQLNHEPTDQRVCTLTNIWRLSRRGVNTLSECHVHIETMTAPRFTNLLHRLNLGQLHPHTRGKAWKQLVIPSTYQYIKLLGVNLHTLATSKMKASVLEQAHNLFLSHILHVQQNPLGSLKPSTSGLVAK